MKKILLVLFLFSIAATTNAQNITLGDLITLINHDNYSNANSFLSRKGWDFEEKKGSKENEDLQAIWAYDRNIYNKEKASSWIYWGYKKMFGYGTYFVNIDIFDNTAYSKIHNSLASYGLKYDFTDTDDGVKTIFYKNEKYIYAEMYTVSNYSSDKSYSIWIFWTSDYSPDNNGQKKIFYENTNEVKEEYYLNKGELDGNYKYYSKKGNLLISGNFRNGKKNGLFKFYTEDGNLDYEYNVVDDSLHGKYTTYFDNGKTRSIDHYFFGTLHGDFKYYHDNGYLMVEGKYNNDKLDGVLKEYNEHGIIALKTYKLDSLHGKYVEYYNNGNVIVETNYLNGQIHGKYNEYYENGNKKLETNYNYGKVNGKYTVWYEDGKINFITSVQNDIQQGVKQYYYYMNDSIYFISYGKMQNNEMEGRWEDIFINSNTGKEKLLTFTNYKNGVENGPFMYFSNDSLVFGSYLDGKLNGQYLHYYDIFHSLFGGLSFSDTSSSMCVLISEGKFKDGKKSGNWQYFDINERLSSCGSYNSGKKTGTWKFYNTMEHEFVTPDSSYTKDFGHILFIESEYKNDLLNGVWRQYYVLSRDVYYCENSEEDSCINWTLHEVDITANYSNDKLHGQYSHLNIFGDTVFYGKYENGQKDGKWFETKYYENDTNYVIAFYNNGDKNGRIEYYKTNGDIEVTGNYKNDKQDGLWEYYKGNTKSLDITFKNDIRHGPSKFYSPSGEVIFYHNYNNDEIDSIAAYNWAESPGTLIYTIKLISKGLSEYKTRRIEYFGDTTYTTTYQNNKKDFDLFEKGEKDGPYSIKINHDIIVSGVYAEGVKDETWVHFFEDQNLVYSAEYSRGEISSEEFYNISDNKLASGKFKIWNFFEPENYEIVKIKNGVRHGVSVIYKNGMKIDKVKFKKGLLKE